MKEFSKISRARLSGVDIKTYIATVKVYLNAYKNPVNDIDYHLHFDRELYDKNYHLQQTGACQWKSYTNGVY
jgi:hypothetical protein